MNDIAALPAYGFPGRGAIIPPAEPTAPVAPVQPEVQDDWFDRTANYFNPGDGPADCLRAIGTGAACGPYLRLSEPTQNILSRVRGGADIFVAAFSIPKFFKNISTLRRNHTEWLQEKQPSGAFRKVFYEFFNTFNTASNGALGLHDAKIFNLNSRVSLVNGVSQVTTIITDGMSLQDEIRTRHEGDKTIKMLKIAKYTTSVVIAAIVLLGIFYAALLQELAFVVLVLSSVYVVTSILSEVINETPRCGHCGLVRPLPVRV